MCVLFQWREQRLACETCKGTCLRMVCMSVVYLKVYTSRCMQAYPMIGAIHTPRRGQHEHRTLFAGLSWTC